MLALVAIGIQNTAAISAVAVMQDSESIHTSKLFHDQREIVLEK